MAFQGHRSHFRAAGEEVGRDHQQRQGVPDILAGERARARVQVQLLLVHLEYPSKNASAAPKTGLFSTRNLGFRAPTAHLRWFSRP